MLPFICQAVLDALFPPRCPLCRIPVGEHGAFCPACYRKLIHVRKLPLDKRLIKALDLAYALTDYHSGMKPLLQSLKYRKDFMYLVHINRILRLHAPPDMLRAIDLAIPVPLHKDKLQSRGFNQTEKIYADWIKENKVVYLEGLARVKDTLPQYGLNRSERRQNMAGAFRLRGNAGLDLRGKKVLLLDDIFTTGLTMEACAKALRRAGATRVVGLALSSDA